MKQLIIADVRSLNDKGISLGHYFSVAQNYLDLYSGYCKVKIAGGPIFKTHFREQDIFLLPYDFIPKRNWLKSKWRILMNCKYLFKNSLPDDIIVIQQSALTTAIFGIALFASSRNNIYIIPYDTDALSSAIKKIIYRFAKSKIKGIICPSERIADVYKKPGCIVTDYIYPDNKCKHSMSFTERQYDIAMIGRINQDKGVAEAAGYLAGTKYKVVIAGNCDNKMDEEKIHRAVHRSGNIASNIELHIGFINEDDYYGFIRKSRFVMLNYRGDYEDRSSGVVLDALFSGTPILGRKCNALKFIEQMHVGYLFDDICTLNLEDIINEKIYDEYLNGIKNYIDKQKEQRNKVVEFLHLNN